MLTKPPLSYASGTSDVPLLGQTVGENLERTVAVHGDREALVDCATSRRWTYSELDVEVDEVALGLMAGGVVRGDRVGIWAPSCAEWVLVQYATAKIGAASVAVDPSCGEDELGLVVRQSGMRTLVAAARDESTDHAATLERVRAGCPDLLDVVHLGEASWRDLVEAGARSDHHLLDERMATLTFDDPATVAYTSGTEGSPRGATLSHHTVLNNGYLVGEVVGAAPADRVALPVPFHHWLGMVTGNLGATSHGSCIVIPAPVFEPTATLAAVADERCTTLYGVPAMFAAELDHPDLDSYDLSTLRTGIVSGPPSPVEVVQQVAQRMHMSEVAVCYGMSETSPVSTMTRLDDGLPRRAGTVGRVLPHLETKVVDPATGLTVPRGEPGELCTRGHAVMLGYWGDDEGTARAVDAAGWMHSGDLAAMDPGGYVRIVGRTERASGPGAPRG